MQLLKSLRDATRHRRLKPPVGGEQFPLPPELIPLHSDLGQQWASEAVVKPHLVKALQRQEHPAFCAVASAMTIAAATGVGITEQRRFPDVFSKAAAWPPVFASYGWPHLDPLPPVLKYWLLSHLQYDGAPLALLVEWFRVQGYTAEHVSAGDVDLSSFRGAVEAAYPFSDALASTSSGSQTFEHFLLVNYSRSAVGQRMFSGGHYAPLGGYHRDLDKVLILEVNSWRYPSVWVDVPLLWEAIRTRVATGKWRGFLKVSAPGRAL